MFSHFVTDSTSHKMTSSLDIQQAQDLIGYRFQDKTLLIEAFHAPGSGLGKLNDRSVSDGNRRLAQLGDSVIKTVILDGLYFTQDVRCKMS